MLESLLSHDPLPDITLQMKTKQWYSSIKCVKTITEVKYLNMQNKTFFPYFKPLVCHTWRQTVLISVKRSESCSEIISCQYEAITLQFNLK